MKSISRGLIFGLVVALVGLQSIAMGQEKGYSHVRIVRLSFVDGTVLVKRPNSAEWAKASVNTPIQQGFTVSTSDGSYAETQFENGSTAQLGQRSKIGFAELALASDGAKINHLNFDQGYATFNFAPKHGDVYSVQAANTTLTPRGKSEFRVDLKQGTVRVEVFDGSVEARTPERTVDLGKGKVLEFNTGNEEALNITHGIEKDDWDKWVGQRNQQTQLALSDSAVAMNSPVYGWSDLDQYGEWAFFPGFGYGWSPFAPMGWTPFSMGQWSYYPSFGYTWISAEPWGWLPFHYGYWNYSPSFGYFWMPGAGGFGTFYPGLVTWFSGPGYVGWAPMGLHGAPVCTSANCVTAVRSGVLQNGGLINTATRVPVRAGLLRPVSSLNLAPGSMARLSGTPVGRGALTAGAAAQQLAARRSALAPNVVIMGETAAQRAAEAKVETGHRSFFSRAFSGRGAQPIQARLGNTLGGRYAVSSASSGANGFRPMGGEGMPGSQARYEHGQLVRSQPVFLPHARGEGASHPMARMGRSGGIRMQASAPSAGYSGPSSSAGIHSSPAMSSPVMSSPSGTSRGSAGASSGGGTRH